MAYRNLLDNGGHLCEYRVELSWRIMSRKNCIPSQVCPNDSLFLASFAPLATTEGAFSTNCHPNPFGVATFNVTGC